MNKICFMLLALSFASCASTEPEKRAAEGTYDGELNILMLSDAGRNGSYDQRLNAEWMGVYADALGPEFVISCGDLFHYQGIQSTADPLLWSNFESIYTHFLERFLPAAVVINEANDVIHFFGNYLDYVSIAPGKATFNLFTIINPDLSLAASTALSRCRAEGKAVTYQDIRVDCPSGGRVIDLVLEPVPMPGNLEASLTAMLFVEGRDRETDGSVEKYDINATTARRIADLEAELRDSQSNLQSTIGELETVNEELQAANEELLTANEELQSSNEELQSVNEELYTVNTEYQQKVDELTMTTNDLSNFLSSTMIGILFIDENFNIRKFTEYVGREFQLMDHDVGRPIQIFAHSFPSEDIVGDAERVLKDLTPIDREVVSLSRRCYTLRIAPYRTTENSIKGLVITIIDSLGAAARAVSSH